ncbi:MAG: sigma-70 family RNA polymerase sigma factor [Porticoccaceae bacterium]|jgi:RNA polymerase sigma-70 factor (ECF subfamily)|nr:sigma-70 family RNA polymerase sigma factor [Porticoccaceae bacterium]MBT5578532.1 sigma-70 family RNA polymerase sigma factor [Porticoccaceae bacterium]MBT7375369.1 sigma-70 family RNA polymerase sigma factor [Porticoccaceae bacterium]
MLRKQIDTLDNSAQAKGRVAVLNTSEKRSDQWSLLLISVGEKRDRLAFAQLFKHFAPLIKSFAQASRHEGWFPGLSDDLVQEVMIKVWQKAAGYNPEKASATTWIYTVARNCRIDMLRRKSNTQHLPLENEDFWHEPDEDTPVSLLRQKRSEDRVQDSLSQLPKEQDEILRKVYLEGKSHAEASSELGLPLGTVKSRVRLALQKMQILVSPEYQDELSHE